MNSKVSDFLQNTCRVCLKSSNDEEMPSILDADLDNIFIYKKIEQCAGIEVLLDKNLPTIICNDCYGLLKAGYKFRIKCRKSEEVLREITSKAISANIEQSLEKNPSLIIESSDSKKGPRSNTKKKNDFSQTPEIIKTEINAPDSPTNFEEQIVDKFEAEAENVMSFEINYHNNEENSIPSDEDKVSIEKINFDIENGKEKPRRIKKTNKRKKSLNLRDKKITKARSKVLTDNEDEKINQKTSRTRKKKQEKRPHICEICGKEFPHNYALKNHIKRHLNEKSFNCEICGYSCVSNMELVRHLRKHTGSKPFKCKYCSRAFGDNSTLIKHERVHRNERPFKCEICGSCFSYPDVLKRHKLVHTGEKPYKCEICGKCFMDRYHLQSHLKTIQHKGDPRVETLLQNIRENNV